MNRPEPLPESDVTGLQRMCQQYLADIEKYGWGADEDWKEYIFEEALQALFGRNVFDWINKTCEEVDG